ncbi:hypothetical protein NBRC116584_34050 [Hydrogenophaga sp. 5NK40-0174]
MYAVTVTAADPSGETVSTTFNYTVTNPPPTAMDDAFTASEDGGVVLVGDALANDVDADGDALSTTPQAVTAGSGGGLFSIDGNGQVTFDPNGEFSSLSPGDSAVTSFTYAMSDGEGGNDTAIVTVTVLGANSAPTVVPGSEPADQSAVDSQAIVPMDVSSAFTDADGHVLTFSAAGLPAGLSIDSASGVISGTLLADASQGGVGGVHSVTITAADPFGASTTTTFTYTVTNPPPTAVDDQWSVSEDALAGPVGNALSNDTDSDGDPLAAAPQTSVAGSQGGLFSIDASGQVTFDPNGEFQSLGAGESVVTSLAYTISDGNGGSASATMDVTVLGANDVPVAVDDAFIVDEDMSTVIPVLDNDSDVDGNPLTIVSVDGQAFGPGITVVLSDGSGQITLDGGGGLLFTPTPDFNGPSAFTYVVDDGQGGQATATVTGTVRPVNDAPVAQDDGPLSIGHDTPVNGNVLPNDSDVDGDPITVTGFTVDVNRDGIPEAFVPGTPVVIPGVGTLSLQPDGAFSFVPAGGYAGPVPVVTYEISDGTDTAQAQLRLGPVAAAPAEPPPPPAPAPAPSPAPVPAPSPGVAPPPWVGTDMPPPVSTPVPVIDTTPEGTPVLVSVGQVEAEPSMIGVTGLGADRVLVGELGAAMPDGLLFVPDGEVPPPMAMVEANVDRLTPALHVQHAVRHEPVTSDHGIYVQRAVRAAQLESRLADSRIRAQEASSDLLDIGVPFLEASQGGEVLPAGSAAAVTPAPAPGNSDAAGTEPATGVSEAAAAPAREGDELPDFAADPALNGGAMAVAEQPVTGVEGRRAGMGFKAQIRAAAHWGAPLTTRASGLL